MSSRRLARAASEVAYDEATVGLDDLQPPELTPADMEQEADDDNARGGADGGGDGGNCDDDDDEFDESSAHNVRVVVRVRPLLPGEVASTAATHSTNLIQIDGEPLRAQRADVDGGGDGNGDDGDVRAASPPTGGHITVGVGGVTGGGPQATQVQQHAFKFDAVLTPHHSQVDVYEAGRVARMLKALIKGYNGTIFAYGQTGSGKTHTMDGISYATKQVSVGPAPVEGVASPRKTKTVRVLKEPSVLESGLSLRCINELFSMIARRTQMESRGDPASAMRYTVKCSFVQIYQESVYDLLADAAPAYVVGREPPGTSSAAAQKSHGAAAGLRIRWDAKRDFYVENLYEFECTSARSARAYFLNGMKKRLVASHRMNASSSRSHCIFTLQLHARSANQPEVRMSKLSLVDLAGSERARLTGATGAVLQQSIHINRSLFVLRKVIKALAAAPTAQAAATGGGKTARALAHVPYRDSALTRILKHSLGGNSLTLMVACLSPSDAYAEENLSTLNYAALAKRISNAAVVNEDPKSALIRRLRDEIRTLREMLARAQQNIVIGAQGQLATDAAGMDAIAGALMPADSALARGLSNSASGAALLAGDGLAASLAVKLVDSVSELRGVVTDNSELRSLYASHAQALEALEHANATLNEENDGLRDRVHFLETVIVEGAGGEVLRSPTGAAAAGTANGLNEVALDGDADEVVKAEQRDLAFELREMREENRRLRAMLVAADFRGTKTSHNNNNNHVGDGGVDTAPPPKSARRETSASSHHQPSNHAGYALLPSSSPPALPSSRGGIYSYSSVSGDALNYGLPSPAAGPVSVVPSPVAAAAAAASSSIVANPHVHSVYRASAQQGRAGRTQQRRRPSASRPRASSSAAARVAHAWEQANRDREERVLSPATTANATNGTWDPRPVPPVSVSYAARAAAVTVPSQQRGVPNLAQAALNNPLIADYMRQHQQQQQQHQQVPSSRGSLPPQVNYYPQSQPQSYRRF